MASLEIPVTLGPVTEVYTDDSSSSGYSRQLKFSFEGEHSGYNLPTTSAQGTVVISDAGEDLTAHPPLRGFDPTKDYELVLREV